MQTPVQVAQLLSVVRFDSGSIRSARRSCPCLRHQPSRAGSVFKAQATKLQGRPVALLGALHTATNRFHHLQNSRDTDAGKKDERCSLRSHYPLLHGVCMWAQCKSACKSLIHHEPVCEVTGLTRHCPFGWASVLVLFMVNSLDLLMSTHCTRSA